MTFIWQVVIPEANIKNFTTDWNNGRALSALVETCIPGSISDWNILDENNAVENITTAMQVIYQISDNWTRITFAIPLQAKLDSPVLLYDYDFFILEMPASGLKFVSKKLDLKSSHG